MLFKASEVKYRDLNTLEEDFNEEELLEEEFFDEDEDQDEIFEGQVLLLAGNETRFLEEYEDFDSMFPTQEAPVDEEGELLDYDEEKGFYIGKTVILGGSVSEDYYEEEPQDLYEEEFLDDFDSLVADEIEEEQPKKPASEGEILVDNFSNAISSLEESLEKGITSWKDVQVGQDANRHASSVVDFVKSNRNVNYEELDFVIQEEKDVLIAETAQMLSQARDFTTINKILEDLENRIKEISEERCEYFRTDIYSEKDQLMEDLQEHVETVIEKQRALIQDEAEEYIEKTVQFYKEKMSEDDQLLAAANNIVSRKEQILDEAYSRSLKLIEEANEQAFRIIEDSNSARDHAERIKANAHNEGKMRVLKYREDAERIIADANIEAAKIIQSAEEQHQSIVESATQDGFNVGYQEGREEAIRENAQLLMDTTNALNSLHEAFPSAVRENEGKLIKIAIILADALTKEEILNRPEICVRVLDKAIRRVSDLERVLIKVNPLDLDLILPKENYFKGILPDVQDFVITGHYAIPRGGCLIETNSGTIDAQFHTQLSIVEEIFGKIRNEYDEAEVEEEAEAEA